ncbi:pyridoxamine 5'-phosphate oxidase family protein [Candidatus Poriferisodalis sp.]|uniref:pyridoxamine 5'-phosphate oxidase family protein n=1 Tax=Candidatus Poriferisodalis sp. TaxID=3101277 RepID=UPI003B596E2E
MSIPVELADIGNQMERFGIAAYVLTVRDDATPHIAHLAMRLDGDVLRCGASRSAAANVADRPNISVLWPPYEPGGYSMIVDAVARTIEGTDGLELELRPSSGVLHRPATPATPASDTGCESDCAPLSATGT